MAARYYIKNSNDLEPQNEFDSLESVVTFWSGNKEEKGELFVSNFSAIKLIYNVKTGEVRPVSAAENLKGITNFYSRDAFSHLIQPILEAISLLAKWELLQHIDRLGDKELSHIIHSNHLDQQGDCININPIRIERTLAHVLAFSKPSLSEHFFHKNEKTVTQKVVYEVLHRYGTSHIHSGQDVDNIMELIQLKLTTHRNTQNERPTY